MGSHSKRFGKFGIAFHSAFGRNRLNGSMPESLGNLKNLEYLVLMGNQLSGPIPEELEKLKLVRIEMSRNRFSGHFPNGICNEGKLEKLVVANNSLIGRLPKSLYNCSSLIRLRFDGNQLTGDISESFGVYPNFDYINLNDYKIYGKISDNWKSLGNLKNLEYLVLMGNQLSGPIPEELEKLKLVRIEMSRNRFSGHFPNGICNEGKLEKLVNQLSGSIPSEIGTLSSLKRLELQDNNLWGPIPKDLGNLASLFILHLAEIVSMVQCQNHW
nr:MDIS1-interacting receptor like kinase 2-like [Tanacetum cinerariifolium]